MKNYKVLFDAFRSEGFIGEVNHEMLMDICSLEEKGELKIVDFMYIGEEKEVVLKIRGSSGFLATAYSGTKALLEAWPKSFNLFTTLFKE